MAILWNKVTWYSKALAVLVFLATFAIAFKLGTEWQEAYGAPGDHDQGPLTVGAGAHCGGFIQNAAVCQTGYHCQLKISNPDTGGTCVHN